MQKLDRRQPLVSVIIPAKNSEGTIERCLKSIRAQTYPNIEVIVVDNHSSDRTREVSKRYGAKTYLKGSERGAQVNFGAAKAAGEYIYRIDADFVLQSDVIREAVESCENYGYDAILIHNTSDSTASFWGRVRRAERECYRNDELNVAARFWRKDVFSMVGKFDESFVAAEDYDLHNRLLRKGFRIGRIEANETHIGEPKTLLEVARTHYYYGKSIGSFIGRNPEKALKQLSPLRESHFRGIFNFLDDPLVAVGFIIYQFVRYAATSAGIISKTIGLASKISDE